MTGDRPEIAAPAKLNLGLEILRRREDGYHDIATIFQAVEPFDTLSLEPADALSFHERSGVAPDGENLALRALELLQRESGRPLAASATLVKRIPAAAGLGGASSDAAAALLLGRAFRDLPLGDDDLARIALGLGSDVPFFLRGGTALATGRGELLEPLPTPTGAWFVIAAPDIAIPRKTATLYGAIGPKDWSDGADVVAQAARLRRGEPLDPDLLGNAFSRPLLALKPELAELHAAARGIGLPELRLSGAGPTHYAVVDDPERAAALASTLGDAVGRSARVWWSAPLPAGHRMTPPPATHG